MAPVSTVRLYFLRAGYLLLVLGLGLQAGVWSAVIHDVSTSELMQGVVTCMLCALSILAMLGIRYPLKMLPLLFWEITWKVIWLLAAALPQWKSGGIKPEMAGTLFACLFVVIYLLVIPWPYVFEQYLKMPGDPWRRKVVPR